MSVDWSSSTTSASSSLPAAALGSPKLSTGAKAGIAVGAAVGGLLIIITVVWALLRRRKLRKARANAEAPIPTTAEMQDQDEDIATRKKFIDGKWRSEMHAQGQIRKLDSRGVHVVPGPPAELEGASSR